MRLVREPEKHRFADAVVGLLKLGVRKRLKQTERLRTPRTALQKRVIEAVFEINMLPTSQTRFELALLLGMPERSVQVDLQNSRRNKKREAVMIGNEVVSSRVMRINEESVDDIPSWVLIDIILKCKQDLGLP